MAVTLTNCSPQAGGGEEQTHNSSHPALAACQRADVQEVVGKETRGKLYKAALPRLMMMQSWLGADPNRIVAAFDQAEVTFDHVSIDNPGALGEPPYQQIVCTGHIQIDMSNATAGQDILGIDGLRWVINFSGQPSDPATDAFTVDVDDVSIGRGMTHNGRSPVQPQPQEQADQNAPEAGGVDQADGNTAADDAARAADEAQAAVAQAEAEMKSPPQAPTQQRGTNNQPSEEDLYAPH
ncbi:hypothetical protein GGR39_003237 [Novosphingobium fluoreni]|uniref:Uncharacterized protein n=1 Tax=Novosphingobium fluoreni TaxID=1391222 RepID=A0A7W6C2Y5_9SPHN|nr:hypothetical protein [Novosphingobium fluoreni]MBB3941557.1 hypothetical protein [Novosphingobium fluoreni]